MTDAADPSEVTSDPVAHVAELLLSLNRIQNLLRLAAELIDEESIVDWQLVRALCDNSPVPMTIPELAKAAGTAPAVVQKQVAALRAAGYLTVITGGKRQLSVTKAGQEFVQRGEMNLRKNLKEKSQKKFQAARAGTLRLVRELRPAKTEPVAAS